MKKNKFRRAIVMFKKDIAGILEETEDGYKFTYNDEFIKKEILISLSLPINNKIHKSKDLFSFFTGLLPEGWYLEIVCSTLKIDQNDTFGILLATCKETIGAVTIKAERK